MPINAMIPLQAKPAEVMSPFDIAGGAAKIEHLNQQNALLQAQSQEKAQAMSDRNALMSVASQQGAINPTTGTLTPNALGQLSKISPNAAMAYTAKLAEAEKDRAEAAKRQYEMLSGQQKDLLAVGKAVNDEAKLKYEQVKSETGDPQKAADAGTQVLTKYRDQYKTDGSIGDNWKKMPMQYDDAYITANLSNPILQFVKPKDFAAQHELFTDDKGKIYRRGTTTPLEVWYGPDQKFVSQTEGTGPTGLKKLGSMSMEEAVARAAAITGATTREKARVTTELTDQNKVGDDTKTGQAYIETLPPAQQKVTQAVVQGAVPLQSFSTRKYQGGKTDRDIQREHAIQADPTYTENRYPMFQEFTKGQQGRNIVSLNTSIAHLGTLADATVAMKNGDVQLANKFMNSVLTQLGKPEQPTLDTARIAVGSELMRTFRGVGAGSEKEIEEWRRNWDAAKSPAQYEATLKEAGELLGGRAFALNETWKSGTRMSTDFPNIVQPQSRAVLRRLGAKSDFVKLGMPRVTNDAEFNALPSGADFTDPNGVVRKKP